MNEADINLPKDPLSGVTIEELGKKFRKRGTGFQKNYNRPYIFKICMFLEIISKP